MAAHESDREDLLREATALVERAEIKIAGCEEPIVVGFRRDGSASFFFGADSVYQFNTAGELRRAYIGGLLYKAERGRLISLRRERTESEVALIRSEPTTNELAGLLEALRYQLSRLREALSSSSFVLIGQVPANGDVVARIRNWLAVFPSEITIAKVPRVR